MVQGERGPGKWDGWGLTLFDSCRAGVGRGSQLPASSALSRATEVHRVTARREKRLGSFSFLNLLEIED